MIVAGFGCRRDAPAEDLAAALALALDAAGCDAALLAALAFPHFRRDHEGVRAMIAGNALPAHFIAQEALEGAADRAVTHSQTVRRYTGITSIAESAALAAAGPGSRLLATRVKAGGATCAIAQGDRTT